MTVTVPGNIGFVADNAYIRVRSVKVTPRISAEIDVEFYANSTIRNSGSPFLVKSYSTSTIDLTILDTMNPIRAAYIYLKSTTEFSTAQDV